MATKKKDSSHVLPMAKSFSAGEKEIRNAGRFNELGTSGLQRTGLLRGQVDEEFLPELRGERARRVYKEMRDNDPVIGAILYAIEMIARHAKWEVRNGKDEHNEFVQNCLEDMSLSFEETLAEILSMLPFGFSWHEVIYKQRSGDHSDPSKRSRYNDGKIGWRKFPIRAQETLSEWVWDEEGGIQGFLQQAPPKYESVEIPINRSLLFRVGSHKGNPEGRSILRNAYRAWYLKSKIEIIEAIGIERDLAGLPVIYRDGEVARRYDTELKNIVTNIRRDEQEGILMPLAYDENNNQLVKLELLSSAGNRQIDVGKVIDRYDRRIAATVLADFILLGQDKTGSFALSSSKTDLFATALWVILKTVADVFNRHAIPRLCALNSIKADSLPELVPLDLETPDLANLGSFITSLAGAGMPLFPDDNLEGYLRKVANLPDKPEEGIPVPPPATAAPKQKASVPGAPRKKRRPKTDAPAKPPKEDAGEEGDN